MERAPAGPPSELAAGRPASAAAPVTVPARVGVAGGVAVGDGGAACWDVLQAFVDARLDFRRIYRRYERRVLTAARARAVPRAHLVLPPDELERLFDLSALARLRDGGLGPLRARVEAIFGAGGDDGLLDTFCSHAYHEIAILAEEHRAVGRFVRIHDPERYRELFAEVSGYYPTRLRRIRRFLEQGLKRLEELLPLWARHRVVIRSAYLFGADLAERAWGEGLDTLYGRMYPGQGAPRGLLEAAHSFHAAGFDEQAREALGRARRAAAVTPASPTLSALAGEIETFLQALGPTPEPDGARGQGAA